MANSLKLYVDTQNNKLVQSDTDASDFTLPVSEVAGKKSICTNAEKDVLHQYRGNLGALKARSGY